tara:strand:- start:1924 stop:2835 length:912 start_codon:yes stop_codon:yes gene_type:complete
MCDHTTLHTTLSERDGDKRALAELKRQLANESGLKAELTKAKIKELKTQIKAEKAMKSALDKSRARFTKNLKNIVKDTDPLTVLSLDKDNLTDLILRAGYDEAIDEFIEQTSRVAKASQSTASIVQPQYTPDQRQQILVDVAQRAASERIFDNLILPQVTSGVRDSLLSMSLDVPLDMAMSTLAQRMEQAQGRQLTEVNTQISTYGRSITASIADAAGINYYLYTGPEDGLTRKFCRPLVNLVVSESQMNKLDNGQGLGVKAGGGGYNCRHSWSPVTKGFIEAAGLKMATSADIAAANKGGKR